MTKLIYLYFLMLFIVIPATAQTKETSLLESFGGIYEDGAGQKYALNPREGFPHFTVMKSGETHMLRHKKAGVFEFSSTRNSWDKIGGTVALENNNNSKRFCVSFNAKKPNCAVAIPLDVAEVTLKLANGSSISGQMIQPISPRSNLAAVLLHGDGDNDRYDLFDVGMYLVSEGFSVFAYDKRNVGKSTGSEVKGDSYDEISRVYAEDASHIVSELKSRYKDKRFGVIGLSQGGWIGAIVSANVHDLAFYVNIAGNISIGWQQWKHYMISYLKRNGFTKADVAEAEDYFESFFGVGLQKTTFKKYKADLAKYRERNWLRRLRKRKLVIWEDEASAIRVIKRNSNDPSEDIKQVTCPSLGIFFEFDHSTPPESAQIFLRSLRRSKSKDVTIRVFPNSTHGGWSVQGYYFDSSKITRMESKALYFLTYWLETI